MDEKESSKLVLGNLLGAAMFSRFDGEAGRRLRLDAILRQKMVLGNEELAALIESKVEVFPVAPGEVLITQGAGDNDIFLVLAGAFDIVVNGRKVNQRSAGDHVGEMAALEPRQPRSASVVCTEESVVARFKETDLSELGKKFPEIYRSIARELSQRLLQRNAHVNSTHEQIRVFIISSAEGLPIARAVQSAFSHDPFTTVVWTDGVFRVANYVLESLEREIDQSDFAIAIAHSDDMVESRETTWPAPRDNVVFELGLFMGKLGKRRAILMEPRGEGVKLPSDLTGIVTVPYRYKPGADAAALMGPACNALRSHILELGPNN